MLSQRMPLLVTFSAFTVICSIALKNWGPSILIVPVATLLMLTSALSPKSSFNVEVNRIMPQKSVIVGEPLTVRLKVVNKGKERIDFLELYDELPPALQLKNGTNHLITSLDSEEKLEFTYEVLCVKRGTYKIGPTCLRTQDTLGFHFSESIEDNAVTLHVLPKIEKLKASDLPFQRTGQWPGVIHSSRRGIGTEFYGLRNYIPGDDLRRIEWKASARIGSLITIENESERSTDIAVILDATSNLTLGDPSETPLEYCIRAAVSLASLLLSLGNQVSIISHCTNRAWLPGGFGKRHLRRVSEHLASVEPGETPLPIGFGLSHIFESKPQVILVSPLLTKNIVEEVKNMIYEGYNIFVISPSFMEILSGQVDDEAKTALRILALERRNTVAELRRYCMVADWNPEVPLRTVMRGIKRWRIQTGK